MATHVALMEEAMIKQITIATALAATACAPGRQGPDVAIIGVMSTYDQAAGEDYADDVIAALDSFGVETEGPTDTIGTLTLRVSAGDRPTRVIDRDGCMDVVIREGDSFEFVMTSILRAAQVPPQNDTMNPSTPSAWGYSMTQEQLEAYARAQTRWNECPYIGERCEIGACE